MTKHLLLVFLSFFICSTISDAQDYVVKMVSDYDVGNTDMRNFENMCIHRDNLYFNVGTAETGNELARMEDDGTINMLSGYDGEIGRNPNSFMMYGDKLAYLHKSSRNLPYTNVSIHDRYNYGINKSAYSSVEIDGIHYSVENVRTICGYNGYMYYSGRLVTGYWVLLRTKFEPYDIEMINYSSLPIGDPNLIVSNNTNMYIASKDYAQSYTARKIVKVSGEVGVNLIDGMVDVLQLCATPNGIAYTYKKTDGDVVLGKYNQTTEVFQTYSSLNGQTIKACKNLQFIDGTLFASVEVGDNNKPLFCAFDMDVQEPKMVIDNIQPGVTFKHLAKFDNLIFCSGNVDEGTTQEICYFENNFATEPEIKTLLIENESNTDPRSFVPFKGNLYCSLTTSATGQELFKIREKRTPQEIKASFLTPKKYGDASFEVNWTATSNLPLSYTSDDQTVAIVDGNTITIVGAGECFITATQEGNEEYDPAEPVKKLLYVSPKNLAISSDIITKEYDGSDFIRLNLDLNGIIDGDEVFLLDNEGSLESINAGENIKATFDNTLTGADASNYNLTVNEWFVNITPKTLTVENLNIASKSYDGNTSAKSFGTETIAGFVNGDQSSFLGFDFEFANKNAGQDIPVIVRPKWSVKKNNYDFTELSSIKANITKAPLTITIDAKIKTYGEENPEFTYTSAGFVNGETEANLDTKPVIVCSATNNSEPAKYPITIQPQVDSNYEINSVSAYLTIEHLTQTLTFDDISDKTYGDKPFVLNATASSGLPVTFRSKNPDVAVIIDGKVKILKPGLVWIQAYQAGSSIYKHSWPERRSFTVSKKTLDVTIPVEDKVYDGTNNATVAGPLVVGCVIGDLMFVGECTGTFDSVDAGEDIAITTTADITYDKEKYTLNHIPVTANITKAPLKIIAEDKTKIKGQKNPIFTFKYEGFVNGENATVLDETPTVSCLADENSETGDYIISPSGGLATNYEFLYETATLTITTATGVNQIAKNNIKLYPVPVVDVLNIKSEKLIKEIVVYSITGNKIATQQPNATQCTINLGKYQSGVYIIYIKDVENNRIVKKITKR